MRIDETWYARPPNARARTSAGGVVARRDEGTGRVLIALARESGGLSGYILPKGGVKPGETVEAAARREIAEEAGFSDLRLLAPLGTRERLSYSRKYWITTHYFLFATSEIDVTPTDRRHAYRPPTWAPLDALPDMFWPEQRRLLDEALETIYALL